MYAAPHFVKHHDLHTHSCSPTCRKVLAVCDKPHTVHLRVGRQGSPRCARVHCGELDAPSTTTVDQCMCVHRHAAYAHHTTPHHLLDDDCVAATRLRAGFSWCAPIFCAISPRAHLSHTHSHTCTSLAATQRNAPDHSPTRLLHGAPVCCTSHSWRTSTLSISLSSMAALPGRPWATTPCSAHCPTTPLGTTRGSVRGLTRRGHSEI
jgi:hypothetical protein